MKMFVSQVRADGYLSNYTSPFSVLHNYLALPYIKDVPLSDPIFFISVLNTGIYSHLKFNSQFDWIRISYAVLS